MQVQVVVQLIVPVVDSTEGWRIAYTSLLSKGGYHVGHVFPCCLQSSTRYVRSRKGDAQRGHTRGHRLSGCCSWQLPNPPGRGPSGRFSRSCSSHTPVRGRHHRDVANIDAAAAIEVCDWPAKRVPWQTARAAMARPIAITPYPTNRSKLLAAPLNQSSVFPTAIRLRKAVNSATSPGS